MSATPNALTPWPAFQSALASLLVRVEPEADVRSYLAAHPDTFDVAEGVCRSARQEFGPQAGLSLRVYRDPEMEDEYLSLCVRLAAYPPDVLERLQSVSAAHDDEASGASGWVLVTTDFRPLG